MNQLIKAFLAVLTTLNTVHSYTKRDCVCGIENPEYRPSEQTGSKYAWNVALLTNDKEAFCGGVLISDHLVLTAASCVEHELSNDFVWNYNFLTDSSFSPSSKKYWKNILGHVPSHDIAYGIAKSFDKVFLHPKFGVKGIHDSDLAILRFIGLSAKVIGDKYTPNTILPICIPQISKKRIELSTLPAVTFYSFFRTALC